MDADFAHVRVFKTLSSYAKAVSSVFHLLQLFAISSSASGGDSIPLLPNFRTLLLFLQLSNMMALIMISQVTLLVKSLLANTGDARDASSTPGSGRFSRGGNGNPLQYSSLEKSYRCRRLMGYSAWGCIELDMTERREDILNHIHSEDSEENTCPSKFSRFITGSCKCLPS